VAKNKKSRNLSKFLLKNATSWDLAISDARRQIAELKQVIKVFQRKRSDGELWPGTSDSETDTGEVSGGNGGGAAASPHPRIRRRPLRESAS